MTTVDPRPRPLLRSLPLLTRSPHPGGRSPMTCQYRCGDACSQPVPNTSDNEYFGDIVTRALSRRTVLKAGGAGATALSLTAWGGVAPAVAAPGSEAPFTPIAPTPASTDDLIVPEGFTWDPIISWGDPIYPGAPEFDFWNQTPQAQEQQAGYNCDYVTLIRAGRRNRGVLVFNNEYTTDEIMFEGITGSEDLTDDQLRIIMAAHGMTVVDVRRRNRRSPWRYQVDGAHNRRLHTYSTFAVDGPAAGSAHLVTEADPGGRTVLGTLNNCAGGTTPWGTVVSGEENFNQYFDATGAPDPQGRLARYGITSGGRGWERVDERFSVTAHPNEPNRFGWIVEVDPEDPTSTPVKRTALGRFKHEGATIRLARDGRAVAYMGDDERFDYIYKFVSRGRYRTGDKAHNLTLLSEGDLYVARFTGDGFEDGISDGTGEWLPLVVNRRSRVPGMSVADVLVFTRQAADLAGATKMDRPEDVEPNPLTGKVYAALTNNTARTPAQIDEPNPRAANRHGHVLELTERGNDAAATRFTWQLVLIAGDPEDPTTYFYGYDKSAVSPISCPDNVAFDADGNLWISTDGMPGTLALCDALYLMPVEGPDKGWLRQFLSVPVGAETCGPVIELEDNTVLVAVQHPGEVSGASPSNVISEFPYLGDGQPRPGVVHVYRP